MFVAPLQAEFGWSRAEVQGMFSVFIFAGLLTFPAIGWLTDRYGVRRVALTGLLGTVVGYLCLGLFTHSVMSFYAGACCLGLLGAGTTPISWTKAITGWFVRQRGLALGLVLAGTGVGGMLAPGYVGAVIAAASWRHAYIALAVIPLLAFPLTWWLLKNPPSRPTRSEGQPARFGGLNLAAALRGYRFWVLSIGFFAASIAIAGSIPNLVPLLTDAGLDKGVVVRLAGMLGITVILGRVVSGFLLDKLWAPAVAAFMLVLPTASALILSQPGPAVPMVAVAIILIGFAAGAEFDLLAYLCGRYFGLAHYSTIYSLLYVMLALGAVIGPPMFGYFHDTRGSYSGAMQIAAGLFLFCALMLLSLGRYPVFDPDEG